MNRKLLIIAVAALLILGISALVFLATSGKKAPKSQEAVSPSPAATVIPSTKEQIDLMNLVPVEKKGEYIFEYLPKSQFYFLRIEDGSKDVQARDEVVALIKKSTQDGDHCKFKVVVWSPLKDSSSKLPDC